MPSRERVAALIARVEEGRYVEALQEFYADDATMQENSQPPRGDRVAEERFYYDPAQLTVAKPTSA